MAREAEVLIEGAGPTGLALALWLKKIGVSIRIIDQAPMPGTTSRALAVHARTLEYYRQLGLADEVIDKGYRFPRVNLWVRQRPRARFSLGEIGEDISPFPFVLMFPQDQHEKLLIDHLRRLGVEVERPLRLVGFSDEADGVRARLERPDGGVEECFATYLAGCDGAHSFVREKLHTPFAGSTYEGLFYVADVIGRGPALNGELHVALDESEFLAIFPMKDKGHARLIGVIRGADDGSEYHWSDVNQRVLSYLDVAIDEVRWFSTYHVHHRVASNFQVGGVFLLGDAAHIHSPVGGQGMNTGIGDAVNLAWKLGEVLQGRAREEILATYEVERIAFARRLVHTTDELFQFISSSGPWARQVRTRIAPFILSRVFSSMLAKRFLFRTVSQTGINYRMSQLSQGEAGPLKGGDRLPWIASVDNFAPLKSLEWQIHLYGGDLRRYENLGLPVFDFEWNGEMARKGLRQDFAYLVRPDGYLGLIARSAEDVRKYRERWSTRERRLAPASVEGPSAPSP